MFKYVLLFCGLLLAFLLAGHLVLNATGVVSAGFESTDPGVRKTSNSKNSSTISVEERRVREAEKTRHRSRNRTFLSNERRKEIEEIARMAGLDPNVVNGYSDAELLVAFGNIPSTSVDAERAPDAVSGYQVETETEAPKVEYQETEALKWNLETEAGVASVQGASGEVLSGEALEAGNTEISEPEYEPIPPEDAPTEAAAESSPTETESSLIEVLLRRIDAGEKLPATEREIVDAYLSDLPENNRGRGSLDNTGGPDAFGYLYVDNVSPDTATYDWIELRGDPSATWPTMSGTTDSYSPWMQLGFSFPFYGVFYDSIRIISNGNIQFTTTNTAYENRALPTTSIAGPVIFPYWDEQKLNVFGGTASNRIAFRSFGTYTVVEWDSIAPYACGTQVLKYEAILYNNGQIKFQYNIILAAAACDSTVTVGIQSNGVAGSSALQYCYGTSGTNFVGPHPASGRAIRFIPLSFVNNFGTSTITNPFTAGVYGASQTVNVSATFINVGSATQTAPVKYRFNNGTVVEETSAELDSLETDAHTFATSLTTPTDTGNYPLWVWTDLATDENHANDTLKMNVRVFPGGGCEGAIEITTAGPDSATYNNVGAGNNSPGVPCRTTTYSDMVFKKEVPAGHTVTFWISSLSWTTKTMNAALRWSGNCPGDSLVKCVYNQSTAGPSGYNQEFTWINTTGSAQTVYFTIGGYGSTSSYTGDFKLAWMDTDYAHDFSVSEITSPLTSNYGPSAVVTVTATVINLGSTTESSPIKYSFDGGETVEEATASLTRFGTESYSFTTQITLPDINGTYPLTVWTDLATDQDRANDTLTMGVTVFAGSSCEMVMELTTVGPDSQTFNNCGAGDNDPGVPCTANSFDDMVFKRTVQPGHTVTFWLSSVAWASKFPDLALRWGGPCPGSTLVDCIYSSAVATYSKQFTWTNSTGSSQDAYFVVGHYSGTTSSYCGNFKLAWMDQLCSPLDPPITEGFEGTTVPNLPNCWVQENVNALSPVWESYATNPRTGSRCGSIIAITAGNNDWLFSPGINMEEGRDYFLSYWRRVGSATYNDSVEVKAGLAPTGTAMTIQVAAFDTCKRTAYVQKLGEFTCPASGVYYIGWHNMSSRSTTTRTYIDDITISASDSCHAGTVTVNSTAAVDSVTLTAIPSGSWYGGTLRYQWYTGATCTSGNEIVGATSSTYKTYASGTFACRVHVLNPDTCAACDSAYATVADCQVAVAPPIIEGFESPPAPALPLCWTQQDVNADGRPWLTSTASPRTGLKCAYNQYSVSGNPTNDWMFTRPLLLTADTVYYLEYWYRCTRSDSIDAMEVVAGTSRTPGGMPIIIDTLFTFSGVTYTPHLRTFTVPTTDTYFLAWHAASGANQGGIKVDDISVITGDDCVAPEVTVNAAIGADSARLKANVSGGLPYSLVQYQWYTGTDCAPGNEITGATTDSLWVTASGSYSFKAWSIDALNCADCDSAYATVIDCGIPVGVPLIEGFESTSGTALPFCWRQENLDTYTRTWQTSSTYPYSGTRNAQVSGYISGGGSSNDWLYSRAVHLSADTLYHVGYWYRTTSANHTPYLEVFAGQAQAWAAMTILVDTQFTVNDTAYNHHDRSFTPPVSGTYYVGWHGWTASSLSAYTCVDDIRIYADGECQAPIVNVPDTVECEIYCTLTASVTGGFGGPLQFQWYTGGGCETGNEIPGATGLQYITFSSGMFSFKAWHAEADTCKACDSVFAIVEPDYCLPGLVPPIYEPWASDTLPDCWSKENGNGDSYVWDASDNQSYSAPYSAYLYTSSTPANDWLFFEPAVLTADSTYRISFWRRAGSASFPQTLSLFVGTVRHSSAMTTTLLAPYTFNNLGSGAAGFIQDIAEYTAPATGSYYFCLRGTSSAAGGATYVDDFHIYKVGDCGAPTTVTASPAVGPDSARLKCTAIGGFGGTLQFQWYTGDTCDPLNLITGATDSIYQAPASGVYSCKAYYVSIDTCGMCDSAMATVIPCAANPYNDWTANPIFFEGFEGLTTPNLPQCWRKQDANNDGRSWASASGVPRTGTRHAYCTYSLADGPQVDDWLYSSGLALTAGDSMNVEYWYRSYLSEVSDTDSIEVYAGSAPRSDFMTIAVDPEFPIPGGVTYDQRNAYFVVPATGTYYIGWHCTANPNQNGVAIDDIQIYRRGLCIAPTSLNVPAVSYPAWVTLTATASGGFGNPIQYQWYTGESCAPGNEITGETTNQYTTLVSGIFSCKAYRSNPDTCSVCDSAYADVMTPQPGELCSNALILTPPAHNGNTAVAGTTVGFYNHCTATCGVDVSTGPDLFYSMTIPGSGDPACRNMAFALTGTGDVFLTIYDGVTNCCVTTLYCNDDDAQFTGLLPWDVPAQHPGGQNSYIAAELNPSTYLIRVGHLGTASGPYTLTVYDNGPCYEPCLPADSVTVTMSAADPTKVWLHFYAPSIGTFNIFSSTAQNNDGDPNNGADPQWSLDTTIEVTTPGQVAWNDIRATVAYRNYVVVHDCPILGRCCYGDVGDPSCVNNTLAECQALSGSWNRYVTCASEPCPVPPYCEAGSSELCDEYISNVTVGAINNSTGCAGGIHYTDYTTLISTSMVIGTGYAISVSNGNAYDDDQCGVWVDWNRDLDFDDAGETITMTGSPGLGPYSATITPPVGAHIGTTAMRVRICYDTGLAPCGIAEYGEVEDYRIIVSAAR